MTNCNGNSSDCSTSSSSSSSSSSIALNTNMKTNSLSLNSPKTTTTTATNNTNSSSANNLNSNNQNSDISSSSTPGQTQVIHSQVTEKPAHYTYLKGFRVEQCSLFLQHKCTQHRPYTCFYWHFKNQRRRRPLRNETAPLIIIPILTVTNTTSNREFVLIQMTVILYIETLVTQRNDIILDIIKQPLVFMKQTPKVTVQKMVSTVHLHMAQLTCVHQSTIFVNFNHNNSPHHSQSRQYPLHLQILNNFRQITLLQTQQTQLAATHSATRTV